MHPTCLPTRTGAFHLPDQRRTHTDRIEALEDHYTKVAALEQIIVDLTTVVTDLTSQMDHCRTRFEDLVDILWKYGRGIETTQTDIEQVRGESVSNEQKFQARLARLTKYHSQLDNDLRALCLYRLGAIKGDPKAAEKELETLERLALPF